MIMLERFPLFLVFAIPWMLMATAAQDASMENQTGHFIESAPQRAPDYFGRVFVLRAANGETAIAERFFPRPVGDRDVLVAQIHRSPGFQGSFSVSLLDKNGVSRFAFSFRSGQTDGRYEIEDQNGKRACEISPDRKDLELRFLFSDTSACLLLAGDSTTIGELRSGAPICRMVLSNSADPSGPSSELVLGHLRIESVDGLLARDHASHPVYAANGTIWKNGSVGGSGFGPWKLKIQRPGGDAGEDLAPDFLNGASKTEFDISDRKQTDSLLGIASLRSFLSEQDDRALGAVRGESVAPPLYKRIWNERDVIFLEPFSENQAATIDFSEITRAHRGVLRLRVRNYPHGDFRLEILKNGMTWKNQTIDAKRWETFSIPFDNESVVVRHHATGWYFEYGFYGYSITRFSGSEMRAGSRSKESKGTPHAEAQWVHAVNGFIPADCQPVGKETCGADLFLARAWIDGGLHPGKVRSEYRGALIPYGGREIFVPSYEVFTGIGKWMPAFGGNVPPKAIPGGLENDGSTLFIARAKHEEGLHPGKIRKEFQSAHIPWGGREIHIRDYEVLTVPK
jgi:hypothetical protein